jgi:hypothetical protein
VVNIVLVAHQIGPTIIGATIIPRAGDRAGNAAPAISGGKNDTYENMLRNKSR